MTIPELIEKLEKATCPDRDIDKAITELFGTKNDHGVLICAGYLGIGMFTSSIDAAVQLCERVLPGWLWLVEAGGDSDYGATVVSDDSSICSDWHKSTPAIALCIAILRALQPKEGE
ncbi:hypothetical protein ABCW43_00190 [Neorhizobium sp. IRAMC:178]|uniref:hypothetical protein n=1 Tax=Neorhizobium tunisiense TaxID=3144793 RepID=UPI0031F60615